MKDTDLELLELAAKAAGIEVRRGEGWQSDMLFRRVKKPSSPLVAGVHWNPLDDDGDSRLLQVALRLTLCMHSDGAAMCVSGDGKHGVEVRDQADPAANARMAVLLLAAEIGKGMA